MNDLLAGRDWAGRIFSGGVGSRRRWQLRRGGTGNGTGPGGSRSGAFTDMQWITLQQHPAAYPF
jgi:hypothetical protein